MIKCRVYIYNYCFWFIILLYFFFYSDVIGNFCYLVMYKVFGYVDGWENSILIIFIVYDYWCKGLFCYDVIYFSYIKIRYNIF